MQDGGVKVRSASRPRAALVLANVIAATLAGGCGEGGGFSDDPQVINAAGTGFTPRLTEVLEDGGSASETDQSGYTAVMAAAFNGDVESLGILFDFGADAEATTEEGYTALHSLAFGPSDDTQAAQLLIDHGADVCALLQPTANYDGGRASEVATSVGHLSLTEFLRAHEQACQ